MTETKDREISLRELASKFAEGDKTKVSGYQKALLDAVKAGTLQAREERRLSRGVARRPVTLGFTTFSGMTARVVQTPPPTKPHETRHYWFSRAVVAAWLGNKEAPLLVSLWLGDELQPEQAPESAAEPSKAIRDQIRAYLKDMATHDPSFDCMKMPGEKVDFHALLACMDSDCLAAKPGTFDGYLKKPAYLCKFETAGRNPGFYEGMAEKMGVNSGKYRRALGKKEAEYEKAKAKRQSGPA